MSYFIHALTRLKKQRMEARTQGFRRPNFQARIPVLRWAFDKLFIKTRGGGGGGSIAEDLFQTQNGRSSLVC